MPRKHGTRRTKPNSSATDANALMSDNAEGVENTASSSKSNDPVRSTRARSASAATPATTVSSTQVRKRNAVLKQNNTSSTEDGASSGKHDTNRDQSKDDSRQGENSERLEDQQGADSKKPRRSLRVKAAADDVTSVAVQPSAAPRPNARGAEPRAKGSKGAVKNAKRSLGGESTSAVHDVVRRNPAQGCESAVQFVRHASMGLRCNQRLKQVRED